MKAAIRRGLDQEGLLPGGLGLSRKASAYFVKAQNYSGSQKNKTLIYSYALAVSEENAAGGKVVTAPTCGSCGVLPAVLRTLQERHSFSDQKILRALAPRDCLVILLKPMPQYQAQKSAARVRSAQLVRWQQQRQPSCLVVHQHN